VGLQRIRDSLDLRAKVSKRLVSSRNRTGAPFGGYVERFR
jgi:hypothetical protein